MPGIGIVTNPNSRRNRRSPGGMHRLAYILGDRGPVAATHTRSDLDRVAEEFKRREIEILGINGGDGTNHVTLTHFIRVYGDAPLPRIALLKGGTMNTVANGCGIKGTPATILHNLVEKYHEGVPFKVIHRDTLKVGDHYGFLFGNGLFHNFLEVYYEGGDAAPWKAVKVLARAAVSAAMKGEFGRRMTRPLRCQVMVDGRLLDRREFCTVAGATVEQIGLGFRPFYRCEERPFSFHVLGIAPDMAAIAFSLGRVYFGLPMPLDLVDDLVAGRVEMVAEEPISYTLDGDSHTEHETLVLETGPRLEIIVE